MIVYRLTVSEVAKNFNVIKDALADKLGERGHHAAAMELRNILVVVEDPEDAWMGKIAKLFKPKKDHLVVGFVSVTFPGEKMEDRFKLLAHPEEKNDAAP